MDIVLPKDVQAGLDAARKASLQKSARLRIEVDGAVHKVLRMWKTGFAIAQEDAPHLRGLVDLFDGANHLFQCLIVASTEEQDEMHYEFKRATAVAQTAALDFVQASDAPAGLITLQR